MDQSAVGGAVPGGLQRGSAGGGRAVVEHAALGSKELHRQAAEPGRRPAQGILTVQRGIEQPVHQTGVGRRRAPAGPEGKEIGKYILRQLGKAEGFHRRQGLGIRVSQGLGQLPQKGLRIRGLGCAPQFRQAPEPEAQYDGVEDEI